jgi:hypothetical protein
VRPCIVNEGAAKGGDCILKVDAKSPEARDLARALRISVWYARHASRGIPGNEQAARACFRYLEKSYRYWGLRGRSCSLVASPGGVVPCSCASFCAPYSSTTLDRGDIYSLRRPRQGDMPPSLHYVRSAPHACHWHTGCTKRFSSKRQLFLHLGEEHGLQPDAETGGFRATGLGARARRRESRATLSRRPRPRSPVDQRFNALETSSSGDALAQQPQQTQPMQQTQQTQSPQSSQSPQSQQPQQPQQTQQTQSPQSSQSPLAAWCEHALREYCIP